MKRKKFSNMSRDQVIAAMANKLAVGNSQVNIKPNFKPVLKSRKVVIAVAGFLCTVLLLGTLLSLDNADKKVRDKEKSSQRDVISVLNPLIKLKAAYVEKEISAELYACYLRDLIVRYDSIPDKFRLSRPIINQKEVYSELSVVWELISPGLRMTINKDLPVFKAEQVDTGRK
jgi:hypothetical protein